MNRWGYLEGDGILPNLFILNSLRRDVSSFLRWGWGEIQGVLMGPSLSEAYQKNDYCLLQYSFSYAFRTSENKQYMGNGVVSGWLGEILPWKVVFVSGVQM